MKKENGFVQMFAVIALLPILLVGVSIYTFNSTQTRMSSTLSELEKKEIELYNMTISSFIGSNMQGSIVQVMIDTVITTNNNSAGKSGEFIAIDFTDISAEIGRIGEPGKIDNTEEYVYTCAQEMNKASSVISLSEKYNVVANYGSTGKIIELKISYE